MEKEKRGIFPSPNASEESKAFAEMIVSGKQTYTDIDRAVCQNIEYASSKCYFFMRNQLNFQMPSKSTLHNWRPIKYIKSGIDETVIKNLKKMTHNLEGHKRECILLLDEVSIRKDLIYNKSTDRIDGVLDFSKGKRSKEVASKALVFMLKAVFGSWKYVLSYYATSDNTSRKFTNIKFSIFFITINTIIQ